MGSMNNIASAILGAVALFVVGGVVYYAYQYSNPGAQGSVSSTTPAGPPTTQDAVATKTGAAPIVVTNTTVTPADTAAVVTGSVSPNGGITNYWYEFGTAETLGEDTTKQNIGNGFITIPATGYITGLVKNTRYFFRLTAQNQYGTVSGAVYSFKTSEGTPVPVGRIPTATTLDAKLITRTGASMYGEVTPNQAKTQFWFEYGKTANLGEVTALTAVGEGSTKTPVSLSLSDLDPATTYYFRINAQNQFGTVNGATLSFETSSSTASVPGSVILAGRD